MCQKCNALLGFPIISKEEMKNLKIKVVERILCEACQDKNKQYIIEKMTYLKSIGMKTNNALEPGEYSCKESFKIRKIEVDDKKNSIRDIEIQEKIRIEEKKSFIVSHFNISKLINNDKDSTVLVLISLNGKKYILYKEDFKNLEKVSK